MRKRIYGVIAKVVIEPDDSGYYAHCPGLPGVHESGASQDEALENAFEAIQAILEARMLQGDAIPESPDLVILRNPPVLPIEGLMPKKGGKNGRRIQTKEILVPAPTPT